MPDVTIETKAYWNEVAAAQEYPQLTQCDEGFQWLGGMEGQVLPTAMKSIPRPVPPPKPAGLLEKVDWGTKQRWEEDSFRHPPLSVSAKAPLHTRQQMRKSYYWGLVINIQLLPAQLRKSSKILWVSAISEAAFRETVSAFIPLSFWQLHAAESICPLFPAV